MAFDPKVAAGGVAVVAIGGGAGVAIHQGTLGSSQEQTSKKSGIELAIENAGFTIETTKSPECEVELKKEFSDENYRLAVTKCAKSKTFESRAVELGLDVLKTEKISETSNEDWTKKWTNQQAAIKKLDSTNSTTWNSITSAKTKIEEVCKTNISITDKTNNEQWHKFLTICVKEDETTAGASKPLAEALKKDFWTNKLTVSAKLDNLGFSIDSTASGCSEKLTKLETSDNLKAIVEVCYKTKKFSDRAKALDLEVLTASNLDNGNWNDIWNPIKDDMKTDVTNNTSKDWNAAKNDVQTYCTTEGKGEKTITKNSKDEDWKKFLKVCTKDKTNQSGKKAKVEGKDFWSVVEY